MTSQGSPYSRFQRALRTNNSLLVRSAAAELGKVQLEDALAVCLVFLASEPDAYAPAATRWHARFVLERGASAPDAQLALAALHAMEDGDRATAADARRAVRALPTASGCGRPRPAGVGADVLTSPDHAAR